MGLPENARGSFAEENDLGLLKFVAPGDTNDSQPHPEGDLPLVVPDWSILKQPEVVDHREYDDK